MAVEIVRRVMEPINPKVTAAAAGGAVGGVVVVGTIIEVAEYFGVPSAAWKPNTVMLLTALSGYVTSLVAGWFRKHVPAE